MRKKVLLGMIGLAGYLALALPAAHGDGVPKDAPAKKDGITKTVLVELKGQLGWNNTFCRVPEFTLSVNGKFYELHFGDNPKLRASAQGLAGQTVIVTGTLVGDRVKATGLKADSGVKTSVQVEIKGKLIQGERIQKGVMGNARGEWPYYGYAWSIRIGKDTYHLDLGGSVTQDWVARGLAGQMVIVTGTLVGDRVKVTDLKEDKDSVTKTTVVEVRGRLCQQLVRDNWVHPKGYDVSRLSMAWVVRAEGKTYVLDFSKGLPPSIARLNGQTVVVTGTLNGDRIAVTDLKPDASGAVQETVNVEVQGQLCQDHNGAWKVAVNGTLYTLDFGAVKEFYRRAQMELQGKKVVVKGTLKDGVIRVTCLLGYDEYLKGLLEHVVPAGK
jgi:predicted RNA-binding protein with TRAM domain